MTYLLDVNVWVALAVAQHVHFATARDWFATVPNDRVCFCRVTQMGFLRLLTNSRVMGEDALTAAAAWKFFEALMDDDRVILASEPPGVQGSWRAATVGNRIGANSWTDAYLAAFASVAGFTLVSFDRALSRYADVPLRILS